MKAHIHTSILSLALLSLALVAQAETYTDEATGLMLQYTVSNGEATVTGGTVPTGEDNPHKGKLVIPRTLGGYPVTTIGEDAFEGYFEEPNPDIQYLEAPSVQTVKGWAFAHCTELSGFNLPEAVFIEESAFSGCFGLTSVSLPKAVSIEGCAFESCDELETVFLPKVLHVREFAFTDCTFLSSVHLPKVVYVGRGAFQGGQSLEKISLPEARSIGKDAFKECYCLETISLPKAVSIGDSAFYACDLRKVSLPKVTSIGEAAFEYCNNMASIFLPEVVSFGSTAFIDCSKLKKIYLGKAPKLKKSPSSEEPKYGQFDRTPEDLTIFYHSEHAQHFFSGQWANVNKNYTQVARPLVGNLLVSASRESSKVSVLRASDLQDWKHTLERSVDLGNRESWVEATADRLEMQTFGTLVLETHVFENDDVPAAFYRLHASSTFMDLDPASVE